MPIRPPDRYTVTAVALHWIIAVMIIGGFSLGLYMSELPISPQKLQYYAWHKWSGITVLALALLRLSWRATHRPPAPLPGPRWQHQAARLVHAALYLLILAIPLSGWLYSSASGYPVVYLGIKALQLPDLVSKDKALAAELKSLHHFLNWTVLGFLAVHVGASLKHYFLDRDTTLRRMLPWPRNSNSEA